MIEVRTALRRVLFGAALAAISSGVFAQSLALPLPPVVPGVRAAASSAPSPSPSKDVTHRTGQKPDPVLAEPPQFQASANSSAPPVGVQVTARSTATIAASMAGQLVEFPAADGDAIKKDQVLARFNCAQQEAAAARAHAEMVKREDLLSTQKSLKALNAYSRSDYVVAQNDVEVAKADLGLAQTAVDNCTIRAPFDGRVANAPVRNYQFVQAGSPLLDIVDDRDLELEFVVPSIWLAWLKIGAVETVQITETQKTYDSKITRISGKVDAASQTIKIYGRIDGDTSDLLPGMSGGAHFAGATQ
jgi:membrane fusion protein (multidrug efflux system)